MGGTDRFEPAHNNAGDLARALELLQSFCSPLAICIVYVEKFYQYSLKKYGLKMFRNQHNPKVKLEQNCEANSEIPGKCWFSLKVGQFAFGKLKTGICENGLV